ncbi:MAG TPA: polymer-forming cytoskeletal protein [Steroidobacteraceae bacterium]|nr:polymer-forming cytoskeletal protein [Steroidobacteraceae bacterium]
MSDTPRRRVTDRNSASATFLGSGTTLTGELQCDGDLVVAGTVNAHAVVRGGFTLADSARWTGGVRANNAVVAGTLEGALLVTEKLEIRKTAHIRGSVQARSIAIAQGAVIEGEMNVTSEEAVVMFEERRET